ncbi:MAG: pyrroloquinoline quinone biosynthesis protein PqqB [Chloroflexota bacterium]|nr:pyrroloquinoline quinone biosynthesis protein PqqB [Chloroflexota bacterium]
MLLGTAAGGGFPQWNCWCPTCRVARAEPGRARPRTQSSLAVSADGRRWFLCNASPDVREQLGYLPVDPPEGSRHVPVEGVVLTDAELDHSLGITLLREGRRLQLWATAAVVGTLERDSCILPVTRAFAQVDVLELPLENRAELRYRDGTGSGLTVEAFPVPGDPPRFAREDIPGHTVGLIIRDRASGGACAFVPGCGTLDSALLDRLREVQLLLFDGTFWSDDELIALEIGETRAVAMGHVPISGGGGSLARLAELPAFEKVYTHINNTNPVLLEDSPERTAVRRAGIQVGMDGMRFRIQADEVTIDAGRRGSGAGAGLSAGGQ